MIFVTENKIFLKNCRGDNHQTMRKMQPLVSKLGTVATKPDMDTMLRERI